MSEPSPLDGLCGPSGSLSREAPDAQEFAALVRSGRARLDDAARRDLSSESRFDLAYNAAHALSLAALRHAGYRPNRQRYVVFQALEHTLGLGPEVWRVLSRAHDVRNRSEYAGGSLDARLLEDTIAACRKVLELVERLPELPRSPGHGTL
jgi:hypothetical protein